MENSASKKSENPGREFHHAFPNSIGFGERHSALQEMNDIFPIHCPIVLYTSTLSLHFEPTIVLNRSHIYDGEH